MKTAKKIAILLVLVTFATAAQASLVTWDFTWERTHRSNVYSGVGMFSYDSSAGNHVTHGGWVFEDLDDELTAFSFEGFVNSASIGVTNALPELFDFSADIGVVWLLAANRFFYSDDAGLGCIANFCTLYDDGDRVRRSTGILNLTRRGTSVTANLVEPELFGLTMGGMLLAIWLRGRRVKI